MPHLEVIHHAPPSAWARVKQAIRSYTLGPLSLKDRELSRKLGWGGGPTASGIDVTEVTALNYAAVWQAVTLIAGDIGSLPLVLYKRDKNGGKTRYTDHPLYEILHTSPNPEMSSMTVRETLAAHALTWGNGFCEIERDQGGRPIALWPFLPTQVQPFRNEALQLKYRVWSPTGRDVIIDPANMIHLHGLGFDGAVGYSVISKARESLGLLAASEKFGATFFGNGTTFGGALKHPKTLTDKAQQSLRDSIESRHQGPERAHRLLILEEGMSFERFGVDPNDAQFLETRQFQIAEVARWFNLPLHKLREMKDSSVRANIEQEALDYYVSTLRPWLVRFEMELNRKLISPRERYIQHIEFVLDGVLRGDMKSRYDSYAVGRQWGWLNVDEIRAFENLGPLPSGEGTKYLSPMNMVPADRLDEVIDKQVAPEPKPVAPAGDAAPNDNNRAIELLQAAHAEAMALLRQQVEAAHAEREDAAAAATAAAAALDEARHASAAEVAAARDAFEAQRAELQRMAEEERAAAVAAVEERAAQAASAFESATAHATVTAEQRNLEATRAAAAEARLAAAEQALAEAEARTAAERSATAESLQALAAERDALLEAATEARDARFEADTRAQDAAASLAALAAERAAVEARLAAAEQALAEAAARTEAEREAGAESLQTLAAERDTLLDAAAEARAASLAADTRAEETAASLAAAAAERAVAQERLAEALATVEAQRAAHAATLAAAVTANRAVLAELFERLVRREVDKARSKRATPAKLRAWAESFYEAHEAETWVSALRAAVGLHFALTGQTGDVEAATTALVDAHFAESKRQMLAVASADPEDFDQAVTATVNRWEASRAQAAADALIRQEIAHVRDVQ